MVDGSSRRLPSWMMGAITAASSDEGTNSAVADNRNGKKKIKQSKNCNFSESKETTSKEKSFSLKKCGTMGKNVKNNVEKQKNGIRRKRNAKSDASPSFSDDGEDELTVQDLVSIAEEYVKNEVGTVENRSLKTDVRSQNKIWAIGLSRYDAGRPDIANHGQKTEAIDKIIVTDDSALSSTSEQSSLQLTRTGDPAQDMLDLFLGPLLKKPREGQEEKKIERPNNDLNFSHELINKNRHEPQEEMLVPSKKKSSLKDKVSILLD